MRIACIRALLTLAAFATVALAAERPNVVFILADDLAERSPEKARDLRRKLKEWQRSVEAPVPSEMNPAYQGP